MQIKSFRVTNFRSLKDLVFNDLEEFVILFGDNDTGKSNILAFLEIVFMRKESEEAIEIPVSDRAPEGLRVQLRETGFWEGDIAGFRDNFFRETREPISFSVEILIDRSKLANDDDLPESFMASLPAGQDEDSLRIEGQIVRSQQDRASMRLSNVYLDELRFYDTEKEGIDKFLPEFEGVDPTVREQVFESILSELDGAFLLIPASRYLVSESELPIESEIDLEPGSFKNWLFRESLDKEGELNFRAIRERFASEPFNAGYLSVARIGNNEIEILVHGDDGHKLPIGRKGSGIQQVLMILAYMIRSRACFVGIEELEVNLSPRSIKSVLSMLTSFLESDDSPVQQLILTTHSPRIALHRGPQRKLVQLNEQGETELLPADDGTVNQFLWPENN